MNCVTYILYIPLAFVMGLLGKIAEDEE